MKKTIFKIAKTELYNLFYSPIAWLLLIVFSFQTALAYLGSMQQRLVYKNLGGAFLNYLHGLTGSVFGGGRGFYASVAGNLYLYIPLLTMGLMSREISSGTIKLLYSSPLKIREIVFGKFLAMLLYNALLVGIVALFAGVSIFNIQSADIGFLPAGLLGIFLLISAYAAIGLFMSCLTGYQVVAAICTLAMLSLLSYIGTIWQEYDFFRDLTYFLSISGRSMNMIDGLITTKDVLYFVVIIGAFLGFSIYKLQDERTKKPIGLRAGRYAGIVVSVMLISYISSRPGLIGYWDTTAIRSNTLSPNAQKIIRQMDAPLEVTTYVNLLDRNIWMALPVQRNANLAIWEPYLRFKPDIKFTYVYYYDTANIELLKSYKGMDLRAIAEKTAKSAKVDINNFKTPEEIRKIINLRPEKNRLVMQLQYKGKTTFLRVFDDMERWPSETEVSAAFQRLLDTKLPMIAFADGDGERSIDKSGDKHYKILPNEISFRYSLVNQGFGVEKVSLKDQEIPSDIRALVIADPRNPLDSVELGKIQRYITAGGNLLIAGEPGRQALLAPLLQPLGVSLKEGMLVQPNAEGNFPGLILSGLTNATDNLFSYDPLKKSRKDSTPVSMPGAAALTYAGDHGWEITPLVITKPAASWIRKRMLTEDQGIMGGMNSGGTSGSSVNGNIGATATIMVVAAGSNLTSTGTSLTATGSNGNATGSGHNGRPPLYSDSLIFSPADGDEGGSFPTALALSRSVNGKPQRIVVTGDADFMSNTELGRRNLRVSNFAFTIGLFKWFSHGEFPIDTSLPDGKDNGLNLTDTSMNVMTIILKWGLPAGLLIFATVLLIRRKRQ